MNTFVAKTGPEQPGASFGDYDAQGVDLSLLRWMLGLTPVERLRVMEQSAQDTRSLLEHGRRHRQAQAGPDC